MHESRVKLRPILERSVARLSLLRFLIETRSFLYYSSAAQRRRRPPREGRHFQRANVKLTIRRRHDFSAVRRRPNGLIRRPHLIGALIFQFYSGIFLVTKSRRTHALARSFKAFYPKGCLLPNGLVICSADGQTESEAERGAPCFIRHLNGCFLSISAETGSTFASLIATGSGRHGCSDG